jgi:uncharacterized protein YcbK (DUF882 family)
MSSFLQTPHSRRQFMNGLVTATFSASLGASLIGATKTAMATTGLDPLPAAVVSRGGEVRDVRLYNPNTHETAHVVFFANGSYNRQALHQLNVFLRDHHQNVPHAMDPGLLTLVHDMQKVFEMRQIHVISAYRTPQTNNKLLRQHITEAKNSYHVKGQAVDLRIPGIPINAARDVAKILAVGGVGYYPRANFIHVDTGPIRYW